MHRLRPVQRPTFAFALVGLLSLTVAACGGTTTTQLGGPSGLRCETAVSAPSGGVASTGATFTLSIGAARDCLWSAEPEAAWLTVSPTEGQGDGSVRVTVQPNPQSGARSGRVVVNGTRVTVTQAGAVQATDDCRAELNRRSATIGHAGGRIAVEVSAGAGCRWQVASQAAWIQPRSGGGTGSATVDLDVAAHEGAARSGTATIAGLTFTVSQEGRPGAGPGDNSPGPLVPAPCVVTLDPPSRSFQSQGGDGSFRVNTTDDCAWSVSLDAPWVTIRAGQSGRGSGEVRYRVDENYEPAPRTAVIRVADQGHVVSQDAGRAQRIEVEGRVSALSGSCPNLSFSVGRWTVVTDSRTKYDDGRCTNVRNGVAVEVEGDVIGENRVWAREIEFD
jgi:hypothetical protein